MKRQTIIAQGFLFFSMLQAQEKQQYLHLTVGGGLHSLSCDLQNGTQSGRFGNTINAGYSYFFTQHWGVQSGLGLQWFNARSIVNYLSETDQRDIDNEEFVFRVNYNDWQEKQQALFMDIPLTLQYRHVLNNKISLQGSVGGKVSIPISSSYITTGGSITSTGYYSRLNVELNDLPEYGFTTITDRYNGKLSLRPSYMAIADVGGLYTLSPKIDLYLGAYVNYGLNNALKTDTKEMYQLDGVYNAVLSSRQTSKVNLLSVGVKVGVYFRLMKPREVKIVDEFAVITPPTAPVQKIDTVIAPQKADTVIAPQKAETVAVVAVEQPVINDSTSIEKEKIADQPLDTLPTIIIYFVKNSDKRMNDEKDELKELSAILKANPNKCLRITGYTCSCGTRESNFRVGLRRANRVKANLMAYGVSATRLKIVSKGALEPLAPNTSEANRQKNRRVEIKVVNCK